MAKKIDFNAILEKGKALALNKGEKVGLGLCAAVAVLFVAMGVLKAISPDRPKSGKPWEVEIADQAAQIEKIINDDFPPGNAPVVPTIKPDDVKNIDWGPFAFAFEPAPMFALAEPVDFKRRNPYILKPMDDPKHIQVDYIRSGVLAYSIDPIRRIANVFDAGKPGPKGPDGAPPAAVHMAKDVQPRRLVVITAVFPWKAQLEEYRKALRLAHLAELLNTADMPRPVGLNVLRAEVSPDIKEPKWLPLYTYDKDDKAVKVADNIQKLLNASLFDETNVSQLGLYLKPGMATPLPLLANFTNLYPVPSYYPTIKLDGIEVEELEKPNLDVKGKEPIPDPKKGINLPIFKKPNPMGEEVPGNVAKERAFKLLPKDLQMKFTGLYNVFHPLGLALDAAPVAAINPFPKFHDEMKKMHFGKKDDKGEPQVQVQVQVQVHDALLRFIDVDVEPGKTYAYTVQVRMANPNFGRKKDAAFQGLAEIEELLSPFTAPNAIRVAIPDEYFVYATDPKFDPKMQVALPKGADWGPALPPNKSEIHHAAPIQVHRWLTIANNEKVADWAIAERLLIRRGEFLGRDGVNVEVPAWRQDLEKFDLGLAPGIVAKKPDPKGLPGGVAVDFLRSPKPLLVDFAGGPRQAKVTGFAAPMKDESAYELLVLSEDGALSVRNSRTDTEDEERVARYNAWRYRILRLKGVNIGPGGIVMPGGK